MLPDEAQEFVKGMCARTAAAASGMDHIRIAQKLQAAVRAHPEAFAAVLLRQAETLAQSEDALSVCRAGLEQLRQENTALRAQLEQARVLRELEQPQAGEVNQLENATVRRCACGR